MLGDADDVVADEGRALACSIFRMLQSAFPLHDRPARIVVLRQLAEDATEVDLAVAQGAKAPGTIDPVLIPAVHTGSAGGIELGVLHVEGADALMVDVDEGQVVKLLQHEVAGIVENIRPRMAPDRSQEAFEGDPIVQIFPGVDFEAEIDSMLFKDIENRLPPAPQLGEGLVDQPSRPLGPRIDVWPRQCSGERWRAP